MKIEITEDLAETLRSVLGDILDGRGNFGGRTIWELEKFYEQLAGEKKEND